MPYIPQNPVIYSNAAAGALAAIILSDKSPTSLDPTFYTEQTKIAATYAQALDMAVGPGGTLPTVVGQLVASISYAAWQNRCPPAAPESLDPATYAELVQVVLAIGQNVGAIIGPIPNLQFPGQVSIDGSDQTIKYLADKLIAGAGITLAVLNPGADEQLQVNAAGGGGATGPADAIAYYDALGNNSGDPLLTAIPVDQFGRAQIRDIREPTGPGSGAVLRQGAWVADGDPTNVQGEGVVVYGPAPNGIQDASNGTIGRVKYDRFQIRLIIGGVDIGSAWRVDPTHMFFTDDTGIQTVEIVRATGVGTFQGITIPNAGGPLPGKLFIGQTVSLHGSSADVQSSSVTANAAQYRSNQYGANAGNGGLSTFKSRGATVGSLAGCIAGDVIGGITCVGVCPDNAAIPLGGLLQCKVPAAFVPAGQNWLPTDWEMQTVPLAGPINSRRVVWRASSEGETQTLRGVRAGGPNVTPATFGTDGTLWSSGTGDPNGFIMGFPGCLFTRTDGGAGTTLYVKETGGTPTVPTNTGWVGK